MKKLLLLVLLLAAAGGGWYYKTKHKQSSTELRLRTGKIERGQTVEGVAASGQVQPMLLVAVGTQVSGVVERLFKDWNDKVGANETIALIDSRRYVAQIAQDNAAGAQARANVERVKAQLRQAERDLVRQRQLAEKKLVAESDLDAAIANADALKAQLEVNEAAVAQCAANLEGDQINLKYCTITSPVEGVVVSRNVDVGQTVAASFNTPTLFQIANDLTKVQVQASVPEAEIGRIHKNQHAPFRVDAYPDAVFDGVVSQIRLASTTVNNVVTYTVIIDAENPKTLLMPGMTANVTFEVAKSEPDSFLVPVAALRWKPTDDILDPAELAAREAKDAAGKDAPENASDAGGEKAHGHGEMAAGEKAAGEKGAGEKAAGEKGEHKGRKHDGTHGRLYVRADELHVRSIRVKVGISDGVKTAVTPVDPKALEDGTEVVLSLAPEEEEAATNPFMPRMMGGRKGGGH